MFLKGKISVNLELACMCVDRQKAIGVQFDENEELERWQFSYTGREGANQR